MFLASRKGRRVLNLAYSWGAAVVIIGALFKLLHWPFGNQMLFIGMMTEFFVFFVSGLEQPEEQYQWEQVYPELLSINPLDRSEMEERRKYLARKAGEARLRAERLGIDYEEEHLDDHWEHAEGRRESHEDRQEKEGSTAEALRTALPQEDVERLSGSLRRLEEAIDRLATLGNLSANTITDWEQLAKSSVDLGKETLEYRSRMEGLNQTMGNLQSLYESQLKDITGQVDAIDQINRRLDNIRRAYDDSLVDSNAFQRENAEMVHRLHDLNMVYARLLEAMTVNIGMPSAMPYRGNYPQSASSSDYRTPYRSSYRDDYPSDNRYGQNERDDRYRSPQE